MPDPSPDGGRNQNRATIKDVAARAQVSPTTVSHVLNEVESARVGEETADRVRAAAAELDYVPSRMAQGLRTQRSQLIALLSDQIATTPHAGEIILGAQERARERGYTLVVYDAGGNPDNEATDIKMMARQHVDGVVYASMYHRVVELPAGLDGPVVMVDARTPDDSVPAVVPDEVAGGRDATRELLDHGHRRIGLPWNRDDIPATHLRLQGHHDVLRQAAIDVDERLVVPEVSVASEGGYRAARHLLSLDDRPTALFCFNDRMAMGAYRATRELGLDVPADISIIGFDDQPYIGEGLSPGLTTLRLPHYEMGEWGVRRLIELLDDDARPDQAQPVLLHCTLVRRGSVAAPPS